MWGVTKKKQWKQQMLALVRCVSVSVSGTEGGWHGGREESRQQAGRQVGGWGGGGVCRGREVELEIGCTILQQLDNCSGTHYAYSIHHFLSEYCSLITCINHFFSERERDSETACALARERETEREERRRRLFQDTYCMHISIDHF